MLLIDIFHSTFNASSSPIFEINVFTPIPPFISIFNLMFIVLKFHVFDFVVFSESSIITYHLYVVFLFRSAQVTEAIPPLATLESTEIKLSSLASYHQDQRQ
jgi:hypothetical protein